MNGGRHWTRRPGPRLVAASPVSERCVHAGVVEHSVYVAQAARDRGVGRRLLDTLAESCETAGIWTIESGIFAENTASPALTNRPGSAS